MQNVVFGLVTGSILAMAAVGFSMVRQTEGFLNIAHGQYLAVGAFVGLAFVDDLGVNVFLAGALTFAVIGVGGILLARLLFDPVRRQGALILLFTSIGLTYALYGVILGVFGSDVKTYPVSFGPQFDLGVATITLGETVIILLAAITGVGLWVFLTRTTLGTWIRAVASNPELARVRGVRVRLVSSAVWFIAAGLAGLAGLLLGVVGNVNAELGWANIPLILAVAVLGGVGRIYGVMAAAMLLGLAMDMSALVISTEYRTVVVFVALILALLLRPQGLFTTESRRDQVA